MAVRGPLREGLIEQGVPGGLPTGPGSGRLQRQSSVAQGDARGASEPASGLPLSEPHRTPRLSKIAMSSPLDESEQLLHLPRRRRRTGLLPERHQALPPKRTPRPNRKPFTDQSLTLRERLFVLSSREATAQAKAGVTSDLVFATDRSANATTTSTTSRVDTEP
jgi:hypothetical protein